MALPPFPNLLQIYIRADEETYIDPSGTSPATVDGNTLGRINDPRLVDPYLIQSTSGNRPSLQLSELGSLPCIRFDGTDDYFLLSHQLIPIQRTMFAVLKVPATGVQTIFCGGNSSLQWRIDNLKQRLVDCNVADIGLSTVGISANTWTQINASWDVQTRQGIFRSNKSNDGTVNGGSGVNGEFPIKFVGQNPTNSGEFYSGDIYMLLMYYSILSLSDKQTVESYISSETGNLV